MSVPGDQEGDSAQGADRRAYYRVKVRVPLRHRALGPDELEALRSEIRTPRPDGDEALDPALAVRLRRLEHKLDLILSQLDERIPAPLGAQDLREVELSGAGMRFESKNAAQEGEYALIELQLPDDPSGPLRAVTRVVGRFEPAGPGDEPGVALAFDTIDEEDREAIVRFSNEVQRQQLRARSAKREAG